MTHMSTWLKALLLKLGVNTPVAPRPPPAPVCYDCWDITVHSAELNDLPPQANMPLTRCSKCGNISEQKHVIWVKPL